MKKVLLFIFMAIFLISCADKNASNSNNNNGDPLYDDLSEEVNYKEFRTIGYYDTFFQELTISGYADRDCLEKYKDSGSDNARKACIGVVTKVHIEGFADLQEEKDPADGSIKNRTRTDTRYNCDLTFKFDNIQYGAKPSKLKVNFEEVKPIQKFSPLRKFKRETEDKESIEKFYEQVSDSKDGSTISYNDLRLLNTRVRYFISKYFYDGTGYFRYLGFKTKVYYDINNDNKPIMFITSGYEYTHYDEKPEKNDSYYDLMQLSPKKHIGWMEYGDTEKVPFGNFLSDKTIIIIDGRGYARGSYLLLFVNYNNEEELVRDAKEVSAEEFDLEINKWSDPSIPVLKRLQFLF